MSEMENILKNRIKEERINHKLSQGDLGEKVGVAKQTVGKYEQAIAKPNLETLTRLADIFDCSTDYLLGRTDDRDIEIYRGIVDGEEYELELDKNNPDKLTPIKFERLIRKLKSVGFDVDKLMDDIDLEND